jgi:hypothetical protein
MPSKTKTLKPGDTPALRRVVAAAIADNGVPTAAANGDDQMADLSLFEAIDCVANCAVVGGSFDVQVFWWYEVAGLWVLDDNIGTVAVTNAGGTEVFPILGLSSASEVCATAVYIRVFNFAGVDATADVWLCGRFRNT